MGWAMAVEIVAAAAVGQVVMGPAAVDVDAVKAVGKEAAANAAAAPLVERAASFG